MKPPSRKPRKKSRLPKAPTCRCPMCGTVVRCDKNIPLHKDGDEWCQFHGLRPEQYDRLVAEGLLVGKRERARRTIEAVMKKCGVKSICEVCSKPNSENCTHGECQEEGAHGTLPGR